MIKFNQEQYMQLISLSLRAIKPLPIIFPSHGISTLEKEH